MKKLIVIMSLAFAICIPKTSFSQNEMKKASQEWNKLEISDIRNQLRGNARKLSLLKEDLKLMYTSMGSLHAEERFLIIHCRENIERIEGVYTCVADMLEQFLRIRKEKTSCYSYLEEYGIQQMKRLATEDPNNIRRMNA